MYEHSAYEMAQIGEFDTFTIWVYSKEGPIPHFHFKNEANNIEGCIRLDEASYFSHSGKSAKLNSVQRKALVKFLQQPADDVIPFTNWQAIIFTWGTNNPKYKIPTSTEMPNYMNLR